MPESLSTLHRHWAAKHRASAEGGRNALRGFRYQTLLAIQKALDVHRDHGRDRIHDGVLTEHLSDILVIAGTPCIVQVKRTLDATTLKKALRELWSIHEVASDAAPDLLEDAAGLTYRVSARFDRCGDPQATIDDWRPDTAASVDRLESFKRRLTVRFEPDPEAEIFERLANDFHDPFPRRTLHAWLGEEFNGCEADVRSLMRGITDTLARLRNARAEERRPTELMVIGDLDEPPSEVLRHEGSGRAVLTGEAPKLEHLRRGFFAPRPVYGALVDQAERWIETHTAGWDPTDGTLRMLWLHGRSGTGKSVALLHMMSALRKRGHGPVLWIGNTIRQLPAAMRMALDLAADGDTQPIIVVDDPYAPNAVDSPFTFWDEAHSLLEERESGARLPLILACGPGEQIDVCEGDLTADRIAIDRLALPVEDAGERQALRLWYRDRTGGDPPRYAEGDDVLLVQLFHDWAHQEPLNHFADRFRNRIRAMAADGLEALFSQIVALNRLYVGYPDAALDRLDDRSKGCIAQLTEEFHLAIHDGGDSADGAALGRPGVWLKHPHLGNVIYDRWFNPKSASQRPVRNGHLRDATLAALEHGRTPQQRTAPLWTVSRGASLEGVDLTGRLSNQDARDVLLQIYRRLDDAQRDLARLPVWIEIERRFPDLGLKPSPWRTALQRLADAAPVDTGLRLTARHLLKTAKMLSSTEQQLIETAVGDLLERLANAGWHDWHPLAVEATFTTGNRRFACLLAQMLGSRGSGSASDQVSALLDRWPNDPDVTRAAIQWLERAPATSIGWSWIWEKARNRASADAALQRLSRRVVGAWHVASPTWTYIWGFLWSLTAGDPWLKSCALGWLGSVGTNHGSWYYVWIKLWESEPSDNGLAEQAKAWLGSVEPNHGSWKYVWEELWEAAPGDDGLAGQAKAWLGSVDLNHGSWGFIWIKLWDGALDGDGLAGQAKAWLSNVEPNHGSWKYVWEELWEAAPGDDGLAGQAKAWLGSVDLNHGSWGFIWIKLWDGALDGDGLAGQAKAWLSNVEPNHGSWKYVWEKLWEAAPGEDGLTELAKAWLSNVEPNHGSWKYVWEKLWEAAPGEDGLTELAKAWLSNVEPNHGSWKYVWEKLWKAAPGDAGLAKLAKAWLSNVEPNHGSWKYVWEELWEAAPGDNGLAGQAKAWLDNVEPNHGSWGFMWSKLWEATSSDNGLAAQAKAWLNNVKLDHGSWGFVWISLWETAPGNNGLVGQAKAWLSSVKPNHGSWYYVWIKLWEAAPGDDGLARQAKAWLISVEPNHGSWKYVWERLWQVAPDNQLETLARAWLTETSYKHASWKYVWRHLWKARTGDSELMNAGRGALAATAGQDRKWPMIFIPMAQSMTNSSTLLDGEMIGWARQWLESFPDHPDGQAIQQIVDAAG